MAFILAVNSARHFFARAIVSRHSVVLRCGDEGTRTPDPLLAKQVLYQLSYIPALKALPCARTWIRTKDLSFIRAAL